MKDMEGEASLDPLRIILVDGSALGCTTSVKQGCVEGRMEGVGRLLDCWSSSCLAKFSNLLGMLIEGFEGEILKLLKRMKK